MTTKPTLLDCTLRDGGNQNNWQFTQEQANHIVSALDDARIDVIEVGYRGGSGSRRDPNAGITARTDGSYLKDLPETKHSKLAVMVVPSVCELRELDGLAEAGVSILRIAAYPWDLERADPFIARARELGLISTINLMAVSYVPQDELPALSKSLKNTPDVFYIADSFGSLRPDEIGARIRGLRQQTEMEIGIHVHNNLGLAAANSLTALGAGASWMDASLCSMARGAGNLATEQAVALLSSTPGINTSADLGIVGEASSYVLRNILPAPMHVGPDEIASGMNDHHFYFQPFIHEESARFGLSPLAVGREIGRLQPRSVKKDIVTAVCEDLIKQLHATKEAAH